MREDAGVHDAALGWHVWSMASALSAPPLPRASPSLAGRGAELRLPAGWLPSSDIVAARRAHPPPPCPPAARPSLHHPLHPPLSHTCCTCTSPFRARLPAVPSPPPAAPPCPPPLVTPAGPAQRHQRRQDARVPAAGETRECDEGKPTVASMPACMPACRLAPCTSPRLFRIHAPSTCPPPPPPPASPPTSPAPLHPRRA